MPETDIERLLDYHGMWLWLEQDWTVRCRIWRVAVTEGVPHGIRYSFTLHDGTGERLLGFDNAHNIPEQLEYDHRHAFRNLGRRIPYRYSTGDQLLADVLTAVKAACDAEGVGYEVLSITNESKTLSVWEDDHAA